MSCNNKEWKTVKLKDISTDGKGFYGIGAPAVDFNENLYTYLRITDITDDGRINKDGLKSVADENAKDYLLKKNDIVFARTGNSTGRAYFYNEKDGNLVYAGFLIKFNLDETKVNPKYIKYFTLSPEYKKWVNSFATGSTRKNINAKMFGDMQIELPNREYQNKVVNILEPLSQKIEHNIEMNRTLEEMAQTLFKHWFVDFEFPNENGEPYKSSGGKFVESELGMIPEGWKVKRIKDVCSKITSGGTPSRKNEAYYKGDIIWLKTKELNDNFIFDSEEKISNEAIVESSAKIFPPYTVLMAMYGATVGRLGISSRALSFNQATCGMVVNSNLITYEYLYLYLFFNREKLINLATGSAQQNLSVNVIKAFTILEPETKILKKFSQVVGIIFKIIEKNTIENSNLIKLKEILLPKLMSGEIRIPEAEEAVESCLQKNN